MANQQLNPKIDPRQQKGSPQQPGPLRSPWWEFVTWLVILTFFSVWYIVVLWPKANPAVNIPYTAFLAQAQSGNVAKVRIVADAITGSLVKPVSLPVSKQETTASAPSNPKDSPLTRPLSDQSSSAAASTYTEFQTTFPSAIGDPNLMPMLEAHDVVVNVSHPSTPWLLELLGNWFPMLLLVGFFWWMGMKATQTQVGLFGLGQSKARRYNEDQSKVTFEDVAGADEAKSDLQEEVDFLRQPLKYHNVGARIPRGVLLVGPPGTGKTLLAQAVAGEAGVPFFSLSASEFVEMFVGVGASRVRDLFNQAKAAAPSIVFIDELDAVGRQRGAGIGRGNDEREQTLNQLLVEMDGFDARQEVIVLAATNRADVLDPALLRPGRFDRQVVVALPDRKGREGILRIHTRQLRLSFNVDLSILARSTTGFSGADLANLCNEAALLAARHNRGEVMMMDFEEAQDKVLLGGARPSLVDPNDRRIVAYHESGHALVAWLTPAADPVHKVTIVPHGRALGVTEQLPGDDHFNYSVTYLMARLAVMLGGRTAEEIAIGDITTGAENDLIEATGLARRMVTRWGMGNLGLVAFKSDDHQPFLGFDLSQGREYSEATAAKIDQEVQRLLDERHKSVTELLTSAREKLDRLVRALLQEETIDQHMLEEVLGPRP
ncbi:MAG TPA: ATP-dependent zinc metalloprotease FtsH [Candidatus Binatia bacterium]